MLCPSVVLDCTNGATVSYQTAADASRELVSVDYSITVGVKQIEDTVRVVGRARRSGVGDPQCGAKFTSHRPAGGNEVKENQRMSMRNLENEHEKDLGLEFL